jgi:hypothetical protein
VVRETRVLLRVVLGYLAHGECHGSAYEIRVRSAKRIQSGSAKQNSRDRPSGSTVWPIRGGSERTIVDTSTFIFCARSV